MSTATQEKQEVKKEFLRPFIQLFKRESKDGKKYLSNDLLIGFYNTKKKNPNEPDVRVCYTDADGKITSECCSLWCNVSKAGNKYLSGKVANEEKTKLIGFITKDKKESKYPDVRVYKQAEYEEFISKKNAAKSEKPAETKQDDDLPF